MPTKNVRRLVAFLPFLLASCVSTAPLLEGQLEVAEQLRAPDYTQAKALMEENQDRYRPEDQVLLHLDRGMVLFYAGENDQSNTELQAADYLDEEIYRQRTEQEVAAALTNDNALDYQAEDFESIYLNAFGSLNYARMGDVEDARVEVRRMQEKLVLFNDRFQNERTALMDDESLDHPELGQGELPFHNSALARYLSMVFERADGAPDDFRISGEELADAFQVQQQLYPFPPPPLPDYQRAGKVPVNAVAFVGMGPTKYEEKLSIVRVPGGLLVQTEGQSGSEGFAIPLFDSAASAEFRFYQFSLPQLRERGSEVDAVVLEVNGGQQQLNLSKVEDIGLIAHTNYEAKWPVILTRSVVRILAKVLINEGSSAALKVAGEKTGNSSLALIGSLVGMAGSALVTASEGADLRGSGFFPSHALVGELWLEPGRYHFSLAYYRGGQLLQRRDLGERTVGGQLNLLQDSYLR